MQTLDAWGARIVHFWREGSRSFMLVDGGDRPLFARYSTDPADIPRLAFEAEVRALIGTDSILRSPPVVANGEGWLIEHRIESLPLEGHSAIEAVVEAARRLTHLELPAAPSEVPSGRLWRRARPLLSRVPTKEIVLAKRAFTKLRLPLVTTHGDFHAGNIFYSQGAIWVIDWELSGIGPLGYDLMQMWATLSSVQDRDLLLERTFDAFPDADRGMLLTLRYVVAVRTAASKLTASRSFDRDVEGASRLIALLPRLRQEAKIGNR